MVAFSLFYPRKIKIKFNEGSSSTNKWTWSDAGCLGKSEDEIDKKHILFWGKFYS